MPTLHDAFDGMRTFRGWTRVGRTVRRGESADRYLVPTPTESLALFREDQTDIVDAAQQELPDGWRIVDAADRPIKPKRPPRDPRDAMKVDYCTVSRKVSVWTGPSREGIKAMKRSKFWFSSSSHRWIAQRDDIAPVVKALHDCDLFRLEVTVDGVPHQVGADGALEPAAQPADLPKYEAQRREATHA